MTRRTSALLIALLLLTVPLGSTQRPAMTYEQLTISSAAVMLDQSKMTGMAGGQGTLQGAEARMRCDGTAPTTSVGVPVQVGSVINFTNLIDARLCQFLRTTGTDAILNVQYWAP